MSLLQTRLQTLVENRRARLRAQAAPRGRPIRCSRPLPSLTPQYYTTPRGNQTRKSARPPNAYSAVSWLPNSSPLLGRYAAKAFAPPTPIPADPVIRQPTGAFDFSLYSPLLSPKDFPLNLNGFGGTVSSDLDSLKISPPPNSTESILASAEKRIHSIFPKSADPAPSDAAPTLDSLNSLFPSLFPTLSAPLLPPTVQLCPMGSSSTDPDADAAYYSAFRQLATLFHAFHSQHTAHIQQQLAAAHSIYNSGTEAALSAESLIYGNELGYGNNGVSASPPAKLAECSTLIDTNDHPAPLISHSDAVAEEPTTTSDSTATSRHSTVSVQQSSPGKKRVSWTVGATSPEPRDSKRQRCSTPFQPKLKVPTESPDDGLGSNSDVEMQLDSGEGPASPNIPILVTECAESQKSDGETQNEEMSANSAETAQSASPAAGEPPLLVAESPVDIERLDSPAPAIPRVNIIQPTPPTRCSVSRESPAAAADPAADPTKALERQCVDWLDTCVRQLVMLVHATRCRQRQTTATCALPNCAPMQHVITHIRSCQRWSCEYPMCVSSRQLIGHYEECEDVQCLVCYKLRVFEKAKRANHTPPAHWLTEGFKVQYNEAIRLMTNSASHVRNIA